MAIPAVPGGQFPADALGGVRQGPEEPLGALELHQGLAHPQELALGRPVLKEGAQIRLGLPPDLGRGIQHPQPRHGPEGLVHGHARDQPLGATPAVHEPEAGRAGALDTQEGQGPVPQAAIPPAGQLERQFGNPHRQHRNLLGDPSMAKN